jgi:hypothetical protein
MRLTFECCAGDKRVPVYPLRILAVRQPTRTTAVANSKPGRLLKIIHKHDGAVALILLTIDEKFAVR